MPFSDAFLVRYPETIESTAWTLTGATAEILGYACQQATARFRGRDWEVWFTPEIPVTANVWTFRGLPGLILKAETDMYKIHCKSLQSVRRPIIRLTARCKEFTRDKWRKFEKEYHEHPYELFNENGTVAFFDEISELNRDNWTIEYNPPDWNSIVRTGRRKLLTERETFSSCC